MTSDIWRLEYREEEVGTRLTEWLSPLGWFLLIPVPWRIALASVLLPAVPIVLSYLSAVDLSNRAGPDTWVLMTDGHCVLSTWPMSWRMFLARDGWLGVLPCLAVLATCPIKKRPGSSETKSRSDTL